MRCVCVYFFFLHTVESMRVNKTRHLFENITYIYIYLYLFILFCRNSVKSSLMLQNLQVVRFSMQVSLQFKVLIFSLLKHDLVWS